MSSPLRTEHLTRVFPAVEALRDVSLELPDGALFALAGPNGAGKSTLIQTALNLHRPSSGRAEVLGTDSRALGPAQRERIGYVSEDQQLPSWMTVRQFLSYCKPFYPTWDDGDLAELLRLYELPLDRKLNALSRGMRVKAMLASSLAYRPSLILLDEPFGGLDVLVREQHIESILDRTPEATVLLASHDLAEIESCATHVGYLNEGRLEFAEEMSALHSRFREIELTFAEPVATPREWPVGWLNPEIATHFIRFIDSRFGTDPLQSEVRRHFPSVLEVTTRAMPLRSIVVALAKSSKGAA